MLFKSLIFIISTTFIICILPNQSYAQVTWKTFDEGDGLFSIQIPSNWFAERLPENEKLAPIDYIFRYADRGTSFAWTELLIDNSLHFNSNDAVASQLPSYENFDNYELLQPIECDTYTLNDAQACSYISTFKLEGEDQRNVLTVISVNSDGVQTGMLFITSSNIFDQFLPVGDYIIKSVSIDSNKINSILNSGLDSDIQSDLPQVPPTINDTKLPQVPNNTNTGENIQPNNTNTAPSISMT